MDLSQICSGLVLEDDGIWHSASGESVSYPTEAHADYAAIEDVSFWFRHRNQCILAMLAASPPVGAFFDVGGGNGYVAAALTKAGYDVVLVEPGIDGVRTAKKRGVKHLVCATTTTAAFEPKSMPAIGLFDVVEHVENDVVFLGEMVRLLQPGGMLFASVPAHAWLWSEEDDRAGHFRRYTSCNLKAAVVAAGLKVVYLSYFFRPMPLPILMFRSLPFRLGLRRAWTRASVSQDHMAKQSGISSALQTLLSREVINVRQKRRMHFGGSILLAAYKA